MSAVRKGRRRNIEHGTVRYGMVWYDMGYGMVRRTVYSVWYVWYGMVQYAWHGNAWDMCVFAEMRRGDGE